MKRPSTTTFIGILTISLCFVILILTLTGLVHSTETMQTQIVQLVSTVLLVVLGFYFGSTHKQPESPKPPINPTPKMSKQVFWDIQSLDDEIYEINGIPLSAQIPASQAPTYYSYAEIMLDDTDVEVLVIDRPAAVTLKLKSVVSGGFYLSTSVVADFAGGRPTRPK